MLAKISQKKLNRKVRFMLNKPILIYIAVFASYYHLEFTFIHTFLNSLGSYVVVNVELLSSLEINIFSRMPLEKQLYETDIRYNLLAGSPAHPERNIIVAPIAEYIINIRVGPDIRHCRIIRISGKKKPGIR